MSFEWLLKRITARLDKADRGDRGWFLITRVHVSLSWLKPFCEYLYDKGGSSEIALGESDFLHLGNIIESGSGDPGVELRRHHLLVMDKPLQLIQRIEETRWNEVILTRQGIALATTAEPGVVLESCLESICFAVEPWTPPRRVVEYSEFRVAVYSATKEIVAACDERIDRDEFDLFVSRVRTDREIKWAIDGIAEYRQLGTRDQIALRDEVRNRIPGAKAYLNWRDVALHTFSLFSLGTSLQRDGSSLLSAVVPPVGDKRGSPVAALALDIPSREQVEGDEDLLAPPAAPATNSGATAENLVAKILRADGWTVAFYTNRRGFGFDLWARKNDRAMVVEVKSSLAEVGVICLTELEHAAATQYGRQFALAVVENAESSKPNVHFILDPVGELKFERKNIATFEASRREWLARSRRRAHKS